jgi:hypothetical protein
MSLVRAVLASNKGRFVLAVIALSLAWQVWLTLAAPRKIAPFPGDRERVNVLATLPFPAERFHVLVFQGYGRVSGTAGNTVEIRNVRRSDLRAIARHYWVRRVEPLPQGG